MFEFPKVELKGISFQVSESLVCSCANRVPCNDRVFKGTLNGQSVAVKTFSVTSRTGISQDEQHWEKLIKLRDDHVIQYFLFGAQSSIGYIVMQLCQGSMLDYCRKTLDESVALHVKATDVMWQIACGLDYLLRLEIEYGNLKLENVLFWKRDSKAKRIVVKLAGYGYNHRQYEDNIEPHNLGCLFYSAATKEETKPNGPITPHSLTEVDDKHRSVALNLISFLTDGSPRSFKMNTLLRHPLFTQCNEDARSKLNNEVIEKEMGQRWNDVEKLQKWITNSNKNNFSLEEIADLEEIFLSLNDTSKIVTEAFKTTPQVFSEYIWHLAINLGSKTFVSEENNQVRTQPVEKPKLLGEGTFATVIKREYKDKKGNRYEAAFKKCKPNTNPEMEEKFDKEIETLRQLNHLFVVKYLDVVVENDSDKFIVMELCEGSLKEYVEGKLGRIPKDSLDDKILIGQVALGLTYIHDKGIIHKDMKLENILLKRQSPRLVLAKIADFGFAKELKPGKTEFSETEQPGTETYMAPELLNAKDGAYPNTFASDVYALGITIARIARKGEHPFSNNKIRRQFSMVKGLVPPNLEGLSWDLIDLILKLTDKDPGKRPEMVLVLRHPYFVLTNDKTKRHFVDQIWDGFKSLSREDRSKQVKKIFNNRNFQEWYHSISGEKPATKEEMEEMAQTLQFFQNLDNEKSGSADVKGLKADTFYPAKKYKEKIKEAITSEYDPDVGNQINQMSLISLIRGRFRGLSRCRLNKLIQHSPKLLVPYFWSHLIDVVNESMTPQPGPFINPISPTKIKFHSAQSKHTIIPELEWSSLYYDDEEVVDELWNTKYSENYEKSLETIQEIIKIVTKCNVSEKVWSVLLDKIGIEYGQSLLYEVVESQSSNAPKVTEIILQRFEVGNMSARIHMLVAANEGDWAADIMRLLFKHGVDPTNAVSKIGMTPVHYAAQNESISGPKLMEILLENGGNPNTRSTGQEKSTPIQLAASNQGDYATDILKLLVKKGGACDEIVDQFEPVHYATMNNGESAPELLDLLLKKRGINVIHRNSGMSLVHFTMFNNGDCGTKVAEKLFKNGAKPNSCDKRKQTPLHLATKDTIGENNQIAIMTAFLKYGGDPNSVDELGRTPVHNAAANEGEYAHEKLQLLLTYKGKLSVRDKGGLLPLHYAIMNKGTSGVKIREQVGYKKSASIPLNSSGETLLHRLVNGNNNQIHLVRTTLENDENPNAKDSLGCSPVHDAVAEIESSVGIDILELLLKKGGDPNLPDEENQHTPVHYAATSLKEWGPSQMKILLENGGNANASGKEGYTPLHLAAMNSGTNGPELTEILLQYGANPNAVDLYYNTPVHLAVLNTNDQIAPATISRLLKNGGNANAPDEQGRTPLHYAIVEKPPNSPIKSILILHGGNLSQKDKDGMTPFRLRMRRY